MVRDSKRKVFYPKIATQPIPIFNPFQIGAVTYMTGADVTNRAAFIGTGHLPNTHDTNYRAISNSWPVFSLSKDLGSIVDTTASPVIFGVGHARSPSCKFLIY